MAQTIECNVEYTLDGRPTGNCFVHSKKYTYPATDLPHLPHFETSKGKLVPAIESSTKVIVSWRCNIVEAPGASILTATFQNKRTGQLHTTTCTAA